MRTRHKLNYTELWYRLGLSRRDRQYEYNLTHYSSPVTYYANETRKRISLADLETESGHQCASEAT